MTDDPVLKMDRVECEKCGAIWLNGQHYWSGTGVKGNELDLAGLVCNNFSDDRCINPCRGQDGGDTWAKRMEDITKGFDDKHAEMTERFRGKGTSLDDL
jgi:CobQ-like glutamine amidotransferase family enzyme